MQKTIKKKIIFDQRKVGGIKLMKTKKIIQKIREK
jgi:hypothetical protein